ncbi:class I SAM-dependent methyltransferase [Coralliovum pocilloporae]|uniref:class I SAM-dependent methyltransferase n=1 Tax=Coralliovum pocilloporae TaxID=3066369 RepID=UPI0033074AFA
MASKLFNTVIRLVEQGRLPETRKWFWKQTYNLLSRVWSDKDWAFMNYGYMPDVPFPLDTEDEPDRAFIGLYQQAVDGLDLNEKTVVEVGSGRGGGSSYIARYFKPASMTGLDYSPATVKRARKVIPPHPALAFDVGDAEALPLADESVDIIVNIESSHCYSNLPKFFSEVERVLKPGGVFTWADIRASSMMESLENQFAETGLVDVRRMELTPGVIKALDAMSERKKARIGRIPLISKFLMEFAATENTKLYKGFRNGKVRYLARRFQKPE